MNTKSPKYSMYTDAGDRAVHDIVVKAIESKMTWEQVVEELNLLARLSKEDFSEATDTAVRECVWNAIWNGRDF